MFIDGQSERLTCHAFQSGLTAVFAADAPTPCARTVPCLYDITRVKTARSGEMSRGGELPAKARHQIDRTMRSGGWAGQLPRRLLVRVPLFGVPASCSDVSSLGKSRSR